MLNSMPDEVVIWEAEIFGEVSGESASLPVEDDCSRWVRRLTFTLSACSGPSVGQRTPVSCLRCGHPCLAPPPPHTPAQLPAAAMEAEGHNGGGVGRAASRNVSRKAQGG